MESQPRPRRVLLCVSGSIAAYKACLVVRGLVKAGAEVRCVLTENAAKLVSPLTLAALSRAPVWMDMFDPSQWDMAHLSLSSWADRVLVAPATADIIARMAEGRAGGPVESVTLATRAPIAVAPAMDTDMWEHRATQANVERLKSYGYAILGPVHGELASGRVGMGRLIDPEKLVQWALA
jgi:phosphopantothenoylcysteine decarboxylase/phosphopantothenate--cysteine ligase